jgi:hypothetical protein
MTGKESLNILSYLVVLEKDEWIVVSLIKKGFIFILAVVLLLGVDQPALAADLHPMALANGPMAGIIQGNALLFNFSFLGHAVSDARLQRSKTSAVNGINAIVKGLDVAETGIAHSRLSDSIKARLMTDIDSNISWFESEKTTIQSANDLATVSRQATLATQRWNSIKSDLKKEVGIITCDDLDSNIQAARNASVIASRKILGFKAGGKDTSKLEKALTSYNLNLDHAATDLSSARAEFDAIGVTGNADVHYAAGLRKLGLSDNELNSSFTDLRTIYSLLHSNS